MNLFKWYGKQLKKSNERMAEIAKSGGFFAKKCPRCDSTDLNQVKPGMGNAVADIGRLAFPLLLLFHKKPKTLNVCKKCGFSWEDR